MRPTHSVLLEVLRARLWVIPSLAALLAGLAALLLVSLDQAIASLGLPLDIDPHSARAVLSTISGAMISFTALVFSITMLVLQSASSQLSPRVVRTFLRDRYNQVVLGLFVATFVFSLLVLASVGDGDVPRLSVAVAVGLVLVSVLAFVSYIDHMAHDIRPSSVTESIAVEALAVIGEIYPDGAEVPETDDTTSEAVARRTTDKESESFVVTWSSPAGYIQSFDREQLLAYADREGADIELQVGSGDFLVHGRPLLSVHKSGSTIAASDIGLTRVVRLGPERTMSEDPEFGFRLLVDVALRALSPSLNDPSTAILAIDRLHELLSSLMDREIPSPLILRTEAGTGVSVPTPDWEAYVMLATAELGLASRPMPQVRRHLLAMIDSLLRDAVAPRQPVLRRAKTELEADPTTEAAR